MAVEKGFTSIALPKLATGVGSLDWEAVKPLIYSQLEDLNIPIFIYSTYRKGVKAGELSGVSNKV